MASRAMHITHGQTPITTSTCTVRSQATSILQAVAWSLAAVTANHCSMYTMPTAAGLGDTFDLVPIGGWYGQGRKAGWLSPILLACWDPDSGELQSVCRCMSGYTDAFYKVRTACRHVMPLELNSRRCCMRGMHNYSSHATTVQQRTAATDAL